MSTKRPIPVVDLREPNKKPKRERVTLTEEENLIHFLKEHLYEEIRRFYSILEDKESKILKLEKMLKGKDSEIQKWRDKVKILDKNDTHPHVLANPFIKAPLGKGSKTPVTETFF